MIVMMNQGEVRILRKFYEKFADQLYYFELALCEKDSELAQDLCQEVWISLAGKVQKMKDWEERQVLAWLRLTGRIKYRRHIQKDSATREFPALLPEEGRQEQISPEEVVLAKILFKETFCELNETERELVRCKIKGLSYERRHPEDERSRNALAIRCSRAFQKWRRLLEREGLEPA